MRLHNIRSRCPLCGQSCDEGLCILPLQCRHEEECCEANPQCDSMTFGADAICENHTTKVCASSPCSTARGEECCEANLTCDSITCAADAHYVDNHATKGCASSPCSAATGGECCDFGPTCDSTACAADAQYVNNHATKVTHPAPAVPPRAENAVRPTRRAIP